jgi:hypothetical protein
LLQGEGLGFGGFLLSGLLGQYLLLLALALLLLLLAVLLLPLLLLAGLPLLPLG